ncbi:MAG: beta-glucosidase [Muribaculaceae bacterium]|nr:beta-glucosidase [Muribaculaceae bacterium]
MKTKHLILLFGAIVLLSTAACNSSTETTNQEDPQEEALTDSMGRPASFENDEAMLDYIEKVHFNYMWEGAEPVSGLARERIHLDGNYPENDQDVVTIGGSGFGVAGLLAAIERKYITREAGVERLNKIVDYLARADRFHGAWPHWLNGPTGKVKPFGQKDNGGDLVESSFLMQTLLCVRQYFKDGNEAEKALAQKIDKLWQEMEFDWYTRGGQDVIYWHWSPNYQWEMNFPLEGYNECLIVYVLAAASPTHSVPASAYHKGWARSGGIKSDAKPDGYALELKHNGAETTGGPLFWAHYSWIGLDPRGLSDQYADYWNVVRNHALSNYAYCVANPKHYKGYGANCWGLTASYSIDGYSAHCPGNDLGVITPTAALSSMPYTPDQSMAALKYFWSKGGWIWGKYGFYDAFSEQSNWTLPHYLAIDQCTIAPMIENYRSGLLWRLFMSCPEVQQGLEKLGFTIKKQ